MISDRIIIEQARLGFVVARAVLAQCERHTSRSQLAWEEREWDVPTWFWSDFIGARSSFEEWGVGQFSGSGVAGGVNCTITLSGVHFHRPSLEAFLGLTDEAGPPETQTSKRGRTPTYRWPETVSAIWGQIYRGDLKPKFQADIEKAMIKLLGPPDASAGESTVRPYAKIVFDEFLKD
jgi:hypothetical protein